MLVYTVYICHTWILWHQQDLEIAVTIFLLNKSVSSKFGKVLFILSWLPLCSSIFDGCIFYKGPKPFSQHMNSKPSFPSWFFIGQFIKFTFPKMYPKLMHVFFLHGPPNLPHDSNASSLLQQNFTPKEISYTSWKKSKTKTSSHSSHATSNGATNVAKPNANGAAGSSAVPKNGFTKMRGGFQGAQKKEDRNG